MRAVSSLVLLMMLSVGTLARAEQVVELKGMTIIGSSEAPKGLSIVPWQTQSPDIAVEKLHFTVADEIFQPLDRDVFRRQLSYYKQLFPVADKHDK